MCRVKYYAELDSDLKHLFKYRNMSGILTINSKQYAIFFFLPETINFRRSTAPDFASLSSSNDQIIMKLLRRRMSKCPEGVIR